MKSFKVLIILLSVCIILSACSNKQSLYSDQGQVFRKVITQDMTTLDTALITDAVSGDIVAQAFEGLYTLNKEDKAEPAIAKSFPKKSNGGKTLTINLRKNAKWSNGDSVTAYDFVYAWRKVVNPKTASEFAYIMSDIKNADEVNAGKKSVKDLGIKAIGKYKLQVDLERPVPYINELLALNTFNPQNEKVAKKFGEQYGTTAEKAVYNGPFKVTNWKVEDKIQLVKNEQYWDKNLRLAISQAINKKGYVNSVLNDGSLPSNNFTGVGTADTPDGKDFARTIKSPLKFNPDLAKKNWRKAQKELGKNKFTFTMNTQDTPASKIAAEYIKSQIESHLPGVTLKIKQMPFKQKTTLELANNYEASYSGWSPDYPDPTAFLQTMTKNNAQNNTDWSNKEYDQLLKDANSKLLRKPGERNTSLQKAEYILLHEAPVAPVYQKGEAHLTNPQVKGLQYHKVGPETTLKHVYIDKSINRETGK